MTARRLGCGAVPGACRFQEVSLGCHGWPLSAAPAAASTAALLMNQDQLPEPASQVDNADPGLPGSPDMAEERAAADALAEEAAFLGSLNPKPCKSRLPGLSHCEALLDLVSSEVIRHEQYPANPTRGGSVEASPRQERGGPRWEPPAQEERQRRSLVVTGPPVSEANAEVVLRSRKEVLDLQAELGARDRQIAELQSDLDSALGQLRQLAELQATASPPVVKQPESKGPPQGEPDGFKAAALASLASWAGDARQPTATPAQTAAMIVAEQQASLHAAWQKLHAPSRDQVRPSSVCCCSSKGATGTAIGSILGSYKAIPVVLPPPVSACLAHIPSQGQPAPLPTFGSRLRVDPKAKVAYKCAEEQSQQSEAETQTPASVQSPQEDYVPWSPTRGHGSYVRACGKVYWISYEDPMDVQRCVDAGLAGKLGSTEESGAAAAAFGGAVSSAASAWSNSARSIALPVMPEPAEECLLPETPDPSSRAFQQWPAQERGFPKSFKAPQREQKGTSRLLSRSMLAGPVLRSARSLPLQPQSHNDPLDPAAGMQPSSSSSAVAPRQPMHSCSAMSMGPAAPTAVASYQALSSARHKQQPQIAEKMNPQRRQLSEPRLASARGTASIPPPGYPNPAAANHASAAASRQPLTRTRSCSANQPSAGAMSEKRLRQGGAGHRSSVSVLPPHQVHGPQSQASVQRWTDQGSPSGSVTPTAGPLSAYQRTDLPKTTVLASSQGSAYIRSMSGGAGASHVSCSLVSSVSIRRQAPSPIRAPLSSTITGPVAAVQGSLVPTLPAPSEFSMTASAMHTPRRPDSAFLASAAAAATHQ
eukprot:TRINITY_DN4018_c0_g1_i7.p1 TRINITY_DN4018_c0_g1~~TRINITY_DN4018_c0_g1_i7.p1  ORF type:complete len:820 (-),score=119.44 TRINITY_DN4018_c0_g1_i7:168-2627(-)